MTSGDTRGTVRAALALLAVITAGQWVVGWLAYAEEAEALGRPVDTETYMTDMAQQTLETGEVPSLLARGAGLVVLLVSAAGAGVSRGGAAGSVPDRVDDDPDGDG